MKRFNHPDLPDDVYVLPLTPGAAATFRTRRSTADLWGDLPVIRALSAPVEFSADQVAERIAALADPREQIESIQPSTRRTVSTADIWNKPARKR